MPFGELLERLRVQRTLVDLRRDGLGVLPIGGWVLGVSRRLVLLRTLDDGRSDGYAVLRRGDITRLDWDTDSLHRRTPGPDAIGRVDPVTREIGLAEWRTAIESATVAAPLLTLRREDLGDQVSCPSRSIELLKHLVVGTAVEPDGAEVGRCALSLDALTRLDFGGRHERALELALGLD